MKRFANQPEFLPSRIAKGFDTYFTPSGNKPSPYNKELKMQVMNI